MPSKNNAHNSLKHWKYQIPGVLLTGLVLAAIQLKFNFLFDVNSVDRWVYPVLLGCAVVFIYGADHLYDLWRATANFKNSKIILITNALFIALSAATALVVLVYHYNHISLSSIWIPVACIILYCIVVFTPFQLRGAKEGLIAVTVTLGLFYPMISESWLLMNWAHLTIVFLVCFQNMLIFSWFEKQKDELLGSFTMFSGMDNKTASSLIWVLMIPTLLAVTFISLAQVQGLYMAPVIGLVYCYMLFKPLVFRKNNFYRFAADLLLLLLII